MIALTACECLGCKTRLEREFWQIVWASYSNLELADLGCQVRPEVLV